jgi:hypothetical protein
MKGLQAIAFFAKINTVSGEDTYHETSIVARKKRKALKYNQLNGLSDSQNDLYA